MPIREALVVIAAAAAAACGDVAQLPVKAGEGVDPALPPPQQSLIPTVFAAKATRWPANTQPTAGDGLRVTRFAGDLDHPRWLHVLPNGDVLVAETDAPPKPEDGKGVKGFIMKRVMKWAGSGHPSANRITLLRDANGDGVVDTRTVFLRDLNSPFGMALRDGSKLYVTVGSNSNVGENGLDKEAGRAAIWEVDAKSGAPRLFATGLRNPNGLAREPGTGMLWTTVNERDELGSDLVPDYMTSVKDGGFYGWPYSYFGRNVDQRVTPHRPDLVATALVPDYALGAHTASLGDVGNTIWRVTNASAPPRPAPG